MANMKFIREHIKAYLDVNLKLDLVIKHSGYYGETMYEYEFRMYFVKHKLMRLLFGN